MSPDEFLARASAGELAAPERAALIDALHRREGDEYTLLLALGRSMAKEHSDLVRSFLERNDDPMLARLALQILCKFWDFASAHIAHVRRFLTGVEWDHDGDVQQMAQSVAGEYLRGQEDPSLLGLLLARTLDVSIDDGDRVDAYLSLARAMGKEWSDLPPLGSLPALDELVEPALIAAAEERLVATDCDKSKRA